MCSMHEQKDFLLEQGRPTEIDPETFKKIIRETKKLGVKSILLIGGEPFVSENIFWFAKEARAQGITPIVITNGTLLKEENILKCCEAGICNLGISMDAATESGFDKIRGSGAFKQVIENIERINDLKDRKKALDLDIRVTTTIMNSNLEELMEIVHMCRRLRISHLSFQPVVVNNTDQSSRDSHSDLLVPFERFKTLDRAIDGLLAYKQSSSDNFHFITNDIKHLKLIREYFKGNFKAIQRPCYAGYNRLQVTQDHRVYFCIPPNKKYDASFGDVKKSTLRGLWFSKDARIRRKLIRKCKVPCLQACSYRDDFLEWTSVFQKFFINKKKSVDF